MKETKVCVLNCNTQKRRNSKEVKLKNFLSYVTINIFVEHGLEAKVCLLAVSCGGPLKNDEAVVLIHFFGANHY